jgi:hypothetical protein
MREGESPVLYRFSRRYSLSTSESVSGKSAQRQEQRAISLQIAHVSPSDFTLIDSGSLSQTEAIDRALGRSLNLLHDCEFKSSPTACVGSYWKWLESG